MVTWSEFAAAAPGDGATRPGGGKGSGGVVFRGSTVTVPVLSCPVQRGRGRDGNGEFPVGFWLPIPVPATKKLPRGDPHERLRGAFLTHPRSPRG